MSDLTMGQRIAQQRKQAGLSQEALGNKMGVSRQAISKWEADGAIPEIDKLIALSKLFGVSVGWLLGVEQAQSDDSTPITASAEELSTAQLEMVEALVHRYQASVPAPRKAHTLALSIFCAVIAIALVITGLSLNNRLTYANRRVADLDAGYSHISAQLEQLSGRLEEITQAAENYDKQLADFSFQITDVADTAQLAFQGRPKYYQQNQSAAIQVSGSDGSVLYQYPCEWDGLNWYAELELPIADGYSFHFLLTDADGTKIQQLDGSFCENLQSSMQIQADFSSHVQFTGKSNTLKVTELEVNVSMPKILPESEDISWTDLSYTLYIDDEAVGHYSMIDENFQEMEHASGISIGKSGTLMEATNLPDNATIRLMFHAALSNGLENEFTCRTCLIRDGLFYAP